jgi:hypothetical protein
VAEVGGAASEPDDGVGVVRLRLVCGTGGRELLLALLTHRVRHLDGRRCGKRRSGRRRRGSAAGEEEDNREFAHAIILP